MAKTNKQLKLEQRERVELLTKEQNKNIYTAISEADEQIDTLKKAAENQEFDKTAKCYDTAIKNINKAKAQIEKTEKLKAREEENKAKPKREKKQPYNERLVEVIEIDGKKKDKWEIQKTSTSPIITKYKNHKPEGLTLEQQKKVKEVIENLKVEVHDMNDDYTDTQFKQFVNSLLKVSKAKDDNLLKSEIEEIEANF